MGNWGISPNATPKEKLKSDMADFLHGLNSTGSIDITTYDELFDFAMKSMDEIYALGQSEKDSNENVELHEMHYDKDGLNLKLGGTVAMVFLNALVDIFEANGGKNFLTMTVHKEEIKYAITIQNCNGVDTPSEKLERFEQALQEIIGVHEISSEVLKIAQETLNKYE